MAMGWAASLSEGLESVVPMRALRPISLALLLSLLPTLAAAQADETSRSWNQPVEPFRIAGNLYYVGASDITSFLITTPQGHILIDGGFVETVPLIRANVKKLGFRLEDVKFLLNNHAHYDHAAGLAELKKLTGAKLVVAEGDAPLLAAGGHGDFAFGDKYLFPPVQADRTIKDGDTVSLGGVTLTAHVTSGHTKGCTTWTMKVKDGERTLDVVFAGSVSVNPGVTLAVNPKYPKIAEDYSHSFETLKALPCDLFLSSHGSFFDLTEKAERLRKGESPNPFIDPKGYRAYLARMEGRFRTQLAEERKAVPSEGEILRVGGAVSRPELISSVPVAYSEAARKARINGVVIVEAVVDEKGDVVRTRVLKGLPLGLDKAAETAVRAWKFKPAMAYGKPVKVYTTLTVNCQAPPEP
jgi:metallo-beta-lactamase class B